MAVSVTVKFPVEGEGAVRPPLLETIRHSSNVFRAFVSTITHSCTVVETRHRFTLRHSCNVKSRLQNLQMRSNVIEPETVSLSVEDIQLPYGTAEKA